MNPSNELRNSVGAETARIAHSSFPKGNGYIELRDKYGSLFSDEDFDDLFSWKGEEEVPASILATVTILQFAEGHPDREAVKQVCGRIDWKYLLGVEITYDGFHFSALSRFRERLVKANAAERLFEIPLKHMVEMGLVRPRGRQRTDATTVLAQIRTLNLLELLGETMRQAVNEVATIAPVWIGSWVPFEWFDRYGKRIENAKLPKEKTKRDALAQTIGQDGYQLLTAIAQSGAPADLFDTPAIQVLRMVWIQHYYGPESSGKLRKKEDLPPAHYMINSPYDLEAQFSRKREITWTGYKAHITETCDDDLPHLITHVQTSPATEPDCVTLPTIHQALDDKGLLPDEHLVDAGYVTIDHLVDSQQDKRIDLVGPSRPDSSWQAKDKTAYDISHFVVDWDAQQVTCPQGAKSNLWSPSTDKSGDESITVRFPKAGCLSCLARERCTHSKHDSRGLQLQPSQVKHESLQQARAYQLTEAFHDRYRPRAGIEGTISQATRSFELRRTRYIGYAKTSVQHLATATAINLSRLYNWWQDHPPAKTRTSSFLALKPACAWTD